MLFVLLFLFAFPMLQASKPKPLTIITSPATSPKAEYVIPVVPVCSPVLSPSTPITPLYQLTELEKEAVGYWQDAHNAYRKAEDAFKTIKLHIPGDLESVIQIIEKALEVAQEAQELVQIIIQQADTPKTCQVGLLTEKTVEKTRKVLKQARAVQEKVKQSSPPSVKK